ncbi:hypothetical protein K502DRAFT_339317 [Neoconidiobolus thromboides FSU 785]|nr:hypothetical protein K502DRAFT_339317 [Neoconidiobolus thromboides FSU 785]
MKFLQILFLFFIIAATYANVCPSGAPFCLDVSVSANQAKFTLQGSKKSGYMAVGLGTSMTNSEIFIAWFDSNGKPHVTQNLGVGHTRPQSVSASSLVVSTDQSSTQNNKNTIVFTRPLKSTIKGGVDINPNDANNMIWAYSDSTPSSDGSIKKHSSRGTFSYSVSSSGSGTISEANTPAADASTSGVATVIIIHGALMLVAWILLPIISIYIARFLKGALGIWWFRLHFGLFVLTGLIGVISIVLVALDRGNVLDNPHGALGVAVMAIYGFQVGLGIYIDKMWSPERTKIPISDKAHWWLGRIVFLLAFANIVYGIVLIGNPVYFWIPTGIIIAGGVGAFTYGQISSKKTQEINGKV